MNVRDATPGDAEAVRQVHRASIEGLGPQSYDAEQVAAWAAGTESADYAAAIEADDLEFVVAEVAGELLGFGSLTVDPSGEYGEDVDAEVTAVYVLPSAARDGIGTEILGVLEERARERDAASLALSSSLNAVPFYDHHGYKEAATYTHEFSSHLDTGVEGEVVAMRKELG